MLDARRKAAVDSRDKPGYDGVGGSRISHRQKGIFPFRNVSGRGLQPRPDRNAQRIGSLMGEKGNSGLTLRG